MHPREYERIERNKLYQRMQKNGSPALQQSNQSRIDKEEFLRLYREMETRAEREYRHNRNLLKPLSELNPEEKAERYKWGKRLEMYRNVRKYNLEKRDPDTFREYFVEKVLFQNRGGLKCTPLPPFSSYCAKDSRISWCLWHL